MRRSRDSSHAATYRAETRPLSESPVPAGLSSFREPGSCGRLPLQPRHGNLFSDWRPRPRANPCLHRVRASGSAGLPRRGPRPCGGRTGSRWATTCLATRPCSLYRSIPLCRSAAPRWAACGPTHEGDGRVRPRGLEQPPLARRLTSRPDGPDLPGSSVARGAPRQIRTLARSVFLFRSPITWSVLSPFATCSRPTGGAPQRPVGTSVLPPPRSAAGGADVAAGCTWLVDVEGEGA